MQLPVNVINTTSRSGIKTKLNYGYSYFLCIGRRIDTATEQFRGAVTVKFFSGPGVETETTSVNFI